MQAARRPRILVVGSLNMDLVVRVDRAPGPGENVPGRDFATIPGGKSSNQAVAAARLGGTTAMIGAVGADAFGASLKAGLDANGVDVRGVLVRDGTPSGTAIIVVEPGGDARLIISGGANGTLSPSDLEARADAFAGADVVLTGFEIPMGTVAAAIRMAKQAGAAVVLDAGPPTAEACREAFEVDVLSPNEAEAAALLGMAPSAGADALAAALADRAAGAVVLKCGAAGAIVVDAGVTIEKRGHAVEVVDTTAAGDAFTAALAVALGAGCELAAATEWANCAGALACTVFGAQPSMPTLGAVNAFAKAVGSTELNMQKGR